MENFFKEEELDKNLTRIKKPTETEHTYQEWNENATQRNNTRTVFNTKFQKNMPTPRQEKQTKSLIVGNKDQVRFNEPKNRSLQTGHLEHFRFHEQTEGNSQDVIQDRSRYNVPPPNLARTMVIGEMHRM